MSSVVLLLLVAAAAYAPGLFHAFVYDDHGTIEENAFLADASHLGRVLTLRTLADPQVIDGQRPVLLVTAFLDRAVWGLDPFGWHLTSLLFHLAAVALFFLLVSRLCRVGAVSNPITPSLQHSSTPFFAALLFAVHPAISEAVQMPSYREDLLAGLFTLAYLVSCASGRAYRPLPWLALALLSKESALAAPALAAALWWLLPATRPPRAAVARHLAVAVLLAGAYLVAGFVQRPLQAAGGAWNGTSLQWPANLLRAPGLFVEYLRLLAAPWPLCADRAVPRIPWPAGLFVLGAVLAAAWRVRRARPAAALGLLWLVLAFLPVSNAVPLFNPVGERYLYLMAPGFALLLAGWCGGRCAGLLAVAACVGILLVPLRLRDWRDDEALWTSVLRVNPGSARAHTWLGLAAKRRGDRGEAGRLFRRAEELNPRDISALVNRAVLAGEGGDPAAAESLLREAARIRPDRPEVWRNLAISLRLQGREAEAASAEAEAARLRPRW